MQASFRSILCFRHQHGMQWGRSDIYVSVLLEATDKTINMDAYELEAARWMNLSEVRATVDHQMLQRALAVSTGLGVGWGEGPG